MPFILRMAVCILYAPFLSRVKYQEVGRHFFNNKEFATTETELIAIAAAAITGLSNPTAASGIPRILYMKAKNKF